MFLAATKNRSKKIDKSPEPLRSKFGVQLCSVSGHQFEALKGRSGFADAEDLFQSYTKEQVSLQPYNFLNYIEDIIILWLFH